MLSLLGSCSIGPVSLDGIKPNLDSKIVVFADTFMIYDILDLEGNEISSNGDSIILIQSLLDESYTGRQLLDFQDTTILLSGMSPINNGNISFRVDSVFDIKSLTQINIISRYDASNFSTLSGKDGQTVDSYSGFNNVTPTNEIVTPYSVSFVDSTSILDSARLVLTFVNDLDLALDGEFKLVSGGGTFYSDEISLVAGNSLVIDTVIYNQNIGKKIKVYFEDVTCPGFSTPLTWSNSKKLEFSLSLSEAYVSNGKVNPLNERVPIGSYSLKVPIQDRGGAFDIYLCSGQLDAQYLLSGIDGPFYLIREITDSVKYYNVDSTLMVKSASPFVRNILFQNDSLHISDSNVVYANYYIRPLQSFPIRIKPSYTVNSAYGAENMWNVCYYEGPVKNQIILTDILDNSLNEAYSHIEDSLNLTNSSIVINVQGDGIGYLDLTDSCYVKYSSGQGAYGDTINWKMGSQLKHISLNNNLTRIRTLSGIDSTFMGALPIILESEVVITADTTLGLRLDDNHIINTGIQRFLGYCEGKLYYTANTPLTINANGLLDSVIFASDSITISIEGDAKAQFTTSSDLELKLVDSAGVEIINYEGILNYNDEGWATEEFKISPSHLSGEELQLFFRGSLGNLETTFIGMKDYLSMRVKLSFY